MTDQLVRKLTGTAKKPRSRSRFRSRSSLPFTLLGTGAEDKVSLTSTVLIPLLYLSTHGAGFTIKRARTRE